MSTDSTVDWLALEAYAAGRGSDEERVRIARWIAEHPDHRAMAAAVEQVVRARAQHARPDWRRDDARRAIFERIHAVPSQTQIGSRRHGRDGAFAFPRWSQFAAVAATVAAAVLLIAFGWHRYGGRFAGPAESSRVYATRAEQRATVVLADGSRIVLAPNSRLVVPEPFGTSTRAVTLSGQALFTVANDRGVPFVVNTGLISTRVLGTVFSVSRYVSTDPVEVAVLSGKVVSGGHGASVVVSSGNVAHVTDSTAVTAASGDLRAYTEWTNGRLLFDRVPVEVLLTTVGRWYGYRFQLADSSMAKARVSTELNVDDRADMLVVLKSLLDVTMTVRGNVITLTPRRSHAAPSRDPHVFTPSREMGR